MKNNYLQFFWLRDKILIVVLFAIGILCGILLTDLLKGLEYSFPSLTIFSYQIPSSIFFSATLSLSVQSICVWSIWIVMDWNSKLYVPWTWLLMGLPLGILIGFNLQGEFLLLLGFTIPWLISLLLSPIVVVVGIDAMSFLAVAAILTTLFATAFALISWMRKLI